MIVEEESDADLNCLHTKYWNLSILILQNRVHDCEHIELE